MSDSNKKNFSEATYLRACASCLLHDLEIVKSIVKYHALNEFNPFSVSFHEDFEVLLNNICILIREADERIFGYKVESFKD